MAEAVSTIGAPGAARVRVQEILLGVAATAVLAGILTFWAWLAISMVQLREEMARNTESIVQLRGEVARNTASIERNTESIRRVESLLRVERSGGETAPRQ